MNKKQDLTPIAKRRTKLVFEAFQEEPDDRDMLFQSQSWRTAICHAESQN
jgi:hypothetical protein